MIGKILGHYAVTAANTRGKIQRFNLNQPQKYWPRSWAGEGDTLILMSAYISYDIGSYSIKGDQQWKPLLNEEANELQPHISPDGRWLAYISDQSGRYEVYVCPYPDVTKDRRQVSTNGGESPLWSPLWSRDGGTLFYRNGDSVLSVAIKTNPILKLEAPETLFRGPYSSSDPMDITVFEPWDIGPDGRFLMMKDAETPTASNGLKINIVLNWTEELKRIMQLGK